MGCYYCKAPNPTGRTMCQNCGFPVTPLSGEDLVGGFLVALFLAINPLRIIAYVGGELFIKHKAKQIMSDLQKAIHAFDEGRYEEVIRFVQRADVKNNYTVEIRALHHFLLGASYLTLEDFSKARNNFNQLLALAGLSDTARVPEALIYRAIAEATYQEWARSGAGANAHLLEAIEAYSKSIRRDAQNPIARRRRAQALVQASRYSEALDDLNVALQYTTNIAGLYAYRALVNIQLGNLQAGRADAEQALNIDPNNSIAITALQKSFAAR
jgi:tetratricopeptide (TPR) repeat protein